MTGEENLMVFVFVTLSVHGSQFFSPEAGSCTFWLLKIVSWASLVCLFAGKQLREVPCSSSSCWRTGKGISNKIKFFLRSWGKHLNLWDFCLVFIESDIQTSRGKGPREVRNWKKKSGWSLKLFAHAIWLFIFQRRITWIKSIYTKSWDVLPLFYGFVRPLIAFFKKNTFNCKIALVWT